jgi:hypothetical protein
VRKLGGLDNGLDSFPPFPSGERTVPTSKIKKNPENAQQNLARIIHGFVGWVA